MIHHFFIATKTATKLKLQHSDIDCIQVNGSHVQEGCLFLQCTCIVIQTTLTFACLHAYVGVKVPGGGGGEGTWCGCRSIYLLCLKLVLKLTWVSMTWWVRWFLVDNVLRQLKPSEDRCKWVGVQKCVQIPAVHASPLYDVHMHTCKASPAESHTSLTLVTPTRLHAYF